MSQASSAFTKVRVISCGLVIAEPTTTLYTPRSMTLRTFSGVSILPSAMTLWLTRLRISLISSKSLSSILSSLLSSV
jgi:hypothetical protein